MCAAPFVEGQAIRFDTVSYTVNASCVAGKQCPVLALPGTQVNVCQGSQGTLAACLGSPATTYTDAGAGSSCPTTAQLTPATGGACLSTADNQGNFGFWALPGDYSYYLRVPATAGGGTYGPYPFSVHGDSGGYTLDSLYATLALACTAAGSGTLAVTKVWTATPTQSLAACQLAFYGLGRIQTALGATVTMGKFSALPSQYVFDTTTLGGTITVPASTTAYLNWWLADPTNAAAATNAALSSGSLNVTSAPGTYAWLTNQVTDPRGVSFLNPPAAFFTSTTLATAFLWNDPFEQSLSLNLSRVATEWPSTDPSSIGVKMVGITGSQYNRAQNLSVTGFAENIQLTNAGGDVTNNLFDDINSQDGQVELHLKPVGGNGVNQNSFLKFSARINSGAHCPSTFVVTAATNATPIVITSTGAGTALNALANQALTVSGVLGNTAANGMWPAVFVDANHVSLTGSVGSGAYTSGGSLRVPIAGTKYLWLDAGSDNENWFPNSNFEDDCTEYTAYIQGTFNIFNPSPRLEANLPGSFRFAAGTLGNIMPNAFTNSGLPLPIISDAGQNGYAPHTFGNSGFGTGATVTGIGQIDGHLIGKILVGSAATSTSGQVTFGTPFTTTVVCWAQDIDAGTYLPATGNLAAVNIFPALYSGNLLANHNIWFGCNGY